MSSIRKLSQNFTVSFFQINKRKIKISAWNFESYSSTFEWKNCEWGDLFAIKRTNYAIGIELITSKLKNLYNDSIRFVTKDLSSIWDTFSWSFRGRQNKIIWGVILTLRISSCLKWNKLCILHEVVCWWSKGLSWKHFIEVIAFASSCLYFGNWWYWTIISIKKRI